MHRIFAGITGFEWDKANTGKNREKHGVEPRETEAVFFNAPLIVTPDEAHSQTEARYFALGRTEEDRLLCVVFTIRAQTIRVISARDMSRKEREIYAKKST